MTRDETFGRRITDLQELRALAHTGRLEILQHLQASGAATATECAAVVGLSPSACSYHLRLLARHGFVEPDSGEASERDGRERRWRAVLTGWQSDPDDSDEPAEAAAVDATLARVLLSSSQRKVLAWVDAAARDEAAWRDASLISNSTILAGADELAALSGRLMALLRPYFPVNRSPDDVPPDARQVHVALRLAPGAGRHVAPTEKRT